MYDSQCNSEHLESSFAQPPFCWNAEAICLLMYFGKHMSWKNLGFVLSD